MKIAPRARGLLLTNAALLLFATTACGSDDGGGEQSGRATGTEEELRRAVEANIAAINDGDAEAARDGQSADCRAQATAEDLSEGIALIAELHGEVTLEEVEIVEFDGTSAQVRGVIGDGASGTTDGGDIDWLYLEQADFLQGSLAPGQTMHHREPYSVDTAEHGRDVTARVLRFGVDAGDTVPTWDGTIE
ncbi:hypothetical protein [Streptomyces sp. RFCAC02]|uniref:hypothetical protein n=1 Tax=Streptomyces sp. RFCAC02 TaxID=2499143 RepID=UPI00101F506B|nr:hypothetical protein [Streptomyces sp. RFCAC02]